MNKVKKISESKVKDINDIALFIKQNNLGNVYKNIPFSALTTLKIGGIISLLYYPKNTESLVKILKLIKKNNIKYFLIGNGSNILANDNQYDGIVISLKEMDFSYKVARSNVRVSGGMSIAKLIFSLLKDNIGGLEFLIGIPGTVGGIIYMNAGAYNHNISELIIELTILDENNDVRVVQRKDLDFSYRNSTIKEKNWIVLDAKLQVCYKEKEKIKEEIKMYLENRKENQPLQYYNAGCTFKNGKISSWKLIDEVGCRGFRIGDAGVSEKHSNFLVNYGKAKAFDMINLINYLKHKVRDEKDIELECEWIFVNFDFEENVV